MFADYPKLGVITKPIPIQLDKELKSDEGCIKFVSPAPVTSVSMDLSAVLRIVKHSEESASEPAYGQLAGVKLGEVMEISSVYPMLKEDVSWAFASDEDRILSHMINVDNQKIQDDAVKYYRSNHFDTNPVGLYSINSHGKFFSIKTLKKVANSVKNDRALVFIVYDKKRTELGKPHIRAFVPTDGYLAVAARMQQHEDKKMRANADADDIEEDLISEYTGGDNIDIDEIMKGVNTDAIPMATSMLQNGVYETGCLREVPLNIRVSIEEQQMLQDDLMTPLPAVPSATAITASDQGLEYIEQLLSDITKNLQEIKPDQMFIDPVQQRLAKLNGILKLEALKEQVAHCEAVCDSILVNIAVASEL